MIIYKFKFFRGNKKRIKMINLPSLPAIIFNEYNRRVKKKIKKKTHNPRKKKLPYLDPNHITQGI